MQSSWIVEVKTLLDWPDTLSFFEGKHFLFGDTSQCSALPMLVFSMQSFPTAIFVCFDESPLHYQTVCKKMGGSCDKITWIDLSSDPLAGVGSLFGTLKDKNLDGKCVIIDSLFSFQCEKNVFDVIGFIRSLRNGLGPKGTLFSRFHTDCFVDYVKWMVYESDEVISFREVSASDVTGKITVTKRGQKVFDEITFTLQSDGKISFRRI